VHPPPALFLGTGRAQSPPSATTGGAPSSQKRSLKECGTPACTFEAHTPECTKNPENRIQNITFLLANQKPKEEKRKLFV